MDIEAGETRTALRRDPVGVQANILAVAREVFAESGLSGSRIEEIAARTETSKRMIYYYFGDKESLYRAVLEVAYGRMRAAEDALDLAGVPPAEALRQLAEFTFDHHRHNPDFIRLVMIENVHLGSHMPEADRMSAQNSSAVRHLADIYLRGCEAGLFRAGIDPVALHWHISALCFFNVSNRSTFGKLFGAELFEEAGQETLRRHVGEMVLRFVLREDAPVEPAEPRRIDPDLARHLGRREAVLRRTPGAAVAERRVEAELLAREMRLPTPEGLSVEGEHQAPTRHGPVRVRVFRPAGRRVRPALVYLHGGLWTMGSPETDWDIATRLAAWSGAAVLSVDYALAPEHPYPVALEQVLDVLRWVRAEAGRLEIDGARVAIGGVEAGGALAACTAQAARGEGPPLRGQLLVTPVCDFDLNRPSCLTHAEGPVLTPEELSRAFDAYCPDHAGGGPAAPLEAPELAGLPPAFIATAEFDPLRDGGLAYAAALRARGVAVETDEGRTLTHGYLTSIGASAAAATALRRMADWLSDRLA